MKQDYENSQLRTRQYWYVDGTFEFNLGGISLILALYFFILAKFEGTKTGGLLNAIMILIVIGGGLLVNWLIRMLKHRITFPRTGFVEYKRERGVKRYARLILVGMIAGLIAALLSLAVIEFSAEVLVRAQKNYSLNWLPGMTGVLIAIAASILAIRVRTLRFFVAAILSFAVGVLAMFYGDGINLGLALYYGIMGMTMLMIGIIVLRNYLSTTTPPTEADND